MAYFITFYNSSGTPHIQSVLCLQVPGQDNGSPVYRYILEMMKVGSDMVTLPIKERNNNRGKKSSNRKNINQDLAALTGGQPSGWSKMYDGNALEYVPPSYI